MKNNVDKGSLIGYNGEIISHWSILLLVTLLSIVIRVCFCMHFESPLLTFNYKL